MVQFEIHAINAFEEDLGVLSYENGELAVYSSAKVAQKIANGMKFICKTRGCGLAAHNYVVMQKEVHHNE